MISRVLRRILLACVLAVPACASSAEFDDLAAQATAARNANDVTKAIDLYQRALSLNSSWQEGWWFLGTLFYDSDRYGPGKNAFEHVTKLNPKAGPAWAFLALCEFETKDYDQSLAHLRQSLSLGDAPDPQLRSVLLFHKALLLTRAGEFDRALETYGAFLRAGKPNDQLLVGIGLASLHMRQLPGEIQPERRDMVLNAGKTASFALAGDYTDADTQFATLLAQYPQSANVHIMRGVYLLARDPEAAVLEMKHAQELAPSNPEANAMLAWVLLLRDDSKDALPYAQAAAEEKSPTSFAQCVLGRALVETGDAAAGLEHASLSQQSDPDNVDTHVVMAAAYARLGKPAEARRERQIALDLTERKQHVAEP